MYRTYVEFKKLMAKVSVGPSKKQDFWDYGLQPRYLFYIHLSFRSVLFCQCQFNDLTPIPGLHPAEIKSGRYSFTVIVCSIPHDLMLSGRFKTVDQRLYVPAQYVMDQKVDLCGFREIKTNHRRWVERIGVTGM